MFRKLLSLFVILLFITPVFALDVSTYEQDWKDANSLYEQALKIQKEKGEGGFLRAAPYEKEYDSAKAKYRKIIKELRNESAVRRIAASELDDMLTGLLLMQSDFLEEMISTEITILPQVLYRSAAVTFYDITKNNDLFLPPLILLPERNWQKYGSAVGDLSVSAPEVTTATALVRTSVFSDKSFGKANYYKMISSVNWQTDFITSELVEIGDKITKLESKDSNNPENLNRIGEAYLLKAFYKRLSDCLYYYQQARALVPKITYTPTYTRLMIFRSKITGVKKAASIPEEMDLKKTKYLRDKAKEYIEIAKIPLLKEFEEKFVKDFNPADSYASSNVRDRLRKNGDLVKRERESAFDTFEKLVSEIYNFGLLKIDSATLDVFKQAADYDSGNPHYRLRLGNIYRIQALRKLADDLKQANVYHAGLNWMNQPEWKYKPKDENAAIDLSTVRGLLNKALYEYKAVEKLSPELGNRALGIYYLGLISFNPANADRALTYLGKTTDDKGLFALEYANYLVSRASNEEKYISFSDELKNNAYSGAVAAYQKIPVESNLKQLGATLLGEDYLAWVMAKMRESGGKTKERYGECIAKLQQARSIDPDNPYIYVSEGYMLYRRGTALSVGDALSLIGESLSMGVRGFMFTASFLSEAGRVDEDKYTTQDFDKWVDQEGEKMEREMKETMGSGNEMIVRKYDPNDFLKAVDVYNTAIAKNPELAISYYYLGRTYTMLSVYYLAKDQAAQAKQYQPLAKAAFKNFLKLSYKG